MEGFHWMNACTSPPRYFFSHNNYLETRRHPQPIGVGHGFTCFKERKQEREFIQPGKEFQVSGFYYSLTEWSMVLQSNWVPRAHVRFASLKVVSKDTKKLGLQTHVGGSVIFTL